MDKYSMWIHYERLHNHNKAKHNKTVCIFLGIYCNCWLERGYILVWLDRWYSVSLHILKRVLFDCGCSGGGMRGWCVWVFVWGVGMWGVGVGCGCGVGVGWVWGVIRGSGLWCLNMLCNCKTAIELCSGWSLTDWLPQGHIFYIWVCRYATTVLGTCLCNYMYFWLKESGYNSQYQTPKSKIWSIHARFSLLRMLIWHNWMPCNLFF